MIGGGGGGGHHSGAGGGAGGLVWLTNQTISSGTYSIVIGSGGANADKNQQGSSNGGYGAKGSDTQAFSKTAMGGGGGGYQGNTDSSIMNGGCGGGSDMRSLIDALGHDEVEEEKEWENASQEFKGEPHTVQDNYDDFSYEPSGNSSMQRRTNGYGDNPLREEELIKEYTEFKKKDLKI